MRSWQAAGSAKPLLDSQIDFSDTPESTEEELRRARRATRPAGIGKERTGYDPACAGRSGDELKSEKIDGSTRRVYTATPFFGPRFERAVRRLVASETSRSERKAALTAAES